MDSRTFSITRYLFGSPWNRFGKLFCSFCPFYFVIGFQTFVLSLQYSSKYHPLLIFLIMELGAWSNKADPKHYAPTAMLPSLLWCSQTKVDIHLHSLIIRCISKSPTVRITSGFTCFVEKTVVEINIQECFFFFFIAMYLQINTYNLLLNHFGSSCRSNLVWVYFLVII